jgi:hypothetical protein
MTSWFFLPGEIFILQSGLAQLAPYSAWISAGLWLLIAAAAFCAVGFLQDAADPTYRQLRDEKRRALRSQRAGTS